MAKTIKRNESFICGHCQEQVAPASKTCRNHCSVCLWSLHVDGEIPGDRNSDCHGLMEPILAKKHKKGIMIVHRCINCRMEKNNSAATDDNWDKLVELMQFG